jgi:hypothetical protein
VKSLRTGRPLQTGMFLQLSLLEAESTIVPLEVGKLNKSNDLVGIEPETFRL